MLLLPKDAKILGQGITGSEGSKALSWMLEYGTNVVAGVTPGKGGQVVQGVPIFNSIEEAIKAVGQIDGAVQFVPPMITKGAVEEAIKNGIKFVLSVAEKVPTQDDAYLYALAAENGANLIGPNSIGLICPSRKLRLGLIGGSKVDRAFSAGNIAIVSKSGSMTAEIGIKLKKAGMGVSWAVGIGGDRIIGTDFVDFLLALEDDSETHATVVFGELGGTYEERIAEFVKNGRITKPVVAFIAGEFTEKLPSEVQFGHAGAIIEGDRGRPEFKRKVLKEAGVKVAEDLDQIPTLLQEAMNLKND